MILSEDFSIVGVETVDLAFRSQSTADRRQVGPDVALAPEVSNVECDEEGERPPDMIDSDSEDEEETDEPIREDKSKREKDETDEEEGTQ